jgi:hypothetical protein
MSSLRYSRVNVRLYAVLLASLALPLVQAHSADAPQLTVTSESTDGTGVFTYTGTNGWQSQTIPAKMPGTGQPGTAQPLTAVDITTIFQNIAAGSTAVGTKKFALTKIVCTGITTDKVIYDTAAGSVTIPKEVMAAGSKIACTFTNTWSPPLPVNILAAQYENPDRQKLCDVSLPLKVACEYDATKFTANSNPGCKVPDYPNYCGDAITYPVAAGTARMGKQRLRVVWKCGDSERYCNTWYAGYPLTVICTNGASDPFGESKGACGWANMELR